MYVERDALHYEIRPANFCWSNNVTECTQLGLMANRSKLEESQHIGVLGWIFPSDHERRSKAFRAQVWVRSVRHEQLCHLYLILHSRNCKWRYATRLLLFHRRLSLQKNLGDSEMAILSCVVEGRPSAVILRCHISTALQQ